MLHRIKKENDINHDKWIGVGGKFELGESPEECLLREVKEETGYTLTAWKYRGIITFVYGEDIVEYMSLFTADEFEGTPIDCNEGVLEWVEKERISELNLWEGDRIFFRLLEEREDFFSLKLVYDTEDVCLIEFVSKFVRICVKRFLSASITKASQSLSRNSMPDGIRNKIML